MLAVLACLYCLHFNGLGMFSILLIIRFVVFQREDTLTRQLNIIPMYLLWEDSKKIAIMLTIV